VAAPSPQVLLGPGDALVLTRPFVLVVRPL
jgi:hypothetical protein